MSAPMRFVTFRHQGRERPGVLLDTGHGPFVLDGGSPRRPPPLDGLAPDLRHWIVHGLPGIAKALAGHPFDRLPLLPLAEVSLCVPLPSAGKIVGAAFNYRDGLARGTRAAPEHPVIFIKSAGTLIGPGEPIRLAPSSDTTYEAELAAIIGRPALNIPREQAGDHIAGYTLFNDVSATRYVREDGGFVRGKNQPASGPLGPWIVPASAVIDPYALPLTLAVDGQVRQRSTVAQMLHRIDALIAYISSQMPLDAGDIIATGTPAGVAAHHRPPAWLQSGQVVTISSAPMFGELTNPVL